MNINNIRPKQSKISDKYSWNLFKYLQKYGIKNHRILFDSNDSGGFHPMNIYVMNGTIGRSLHSIMGDARKFRCCLSLYPLDTYEDITEAFWKQYLLLGRCMFDERHAGWWTGGDSRFTVINKNAKRCNWCGKHLRRTITKHVTVKRIERWEVQ